MKRTSGFGRNTPIRPATKDDLDAQPVHGYGTKDDLDETPILLLNSGGCTTGRAS